MRAGREPLPLAAARLAGVGGQVFHARFARLEALPWRRQLLAALGLGLLSALALPPVHAVPVLLIAIPGLLVLAGAQPRLAAGGLDRLRLGLGAWRRRHLVGDRGHPEGCRQFLVAGAAGGAGAGDRAGVVRRAAGAGGAAVAGGLAAGGRLRRRLGAGGAGARRPVHRLPLEPDRDGLGLRRPAGAGRRR